MNILSYMNSDQWASLVRLGLTIGGTWLTKNGYASDSDLQLLAGAIGPVAAFSWSMLHHRGETKAALKAQANS